MYYINKQQVSHTQTIHNQQHRNEGQPHHERRDRVAEHLAQRHPRAAHRLQYDNNINDNNIDNNRNNSNNDNDSNNSCYVC